MDVFRICYTSDKENRIYPLTPAKQQIESRPPDNEGNDIDAVVEQILFLFVELGEIFLAFVVLEQEYFIDIISAYTENYEQ